MSILVRCLLPVLLSATFISSSFAQFSLPGITPGTKIGDNAAKKEVVKVSADYMLAADGKHGVLLVTAKLSKGWHIYSITQAAGPIKRTVIRLDESDGIELLGSFRAEHPPEKKPEEVYDGLIVESHHNLVTWQAPFQVTDPALLPSLKIKGHINVQVCNAQQCLAPKNYNFEASNKKTLTEIVDPHVSISGKIETTDRDTLRLTFDAQTAEHWHAYALAPRDPVEISKPTLVAIPAPEGTTVFAPRASLKPKVVDSEIIPGQKVSYYEGPVQWTVDIKGKLPHAGTHVISGLLGYQTCSNNSCDQPTGSRFITTVHVSDSGAVETGGVMFAKVGYSEVSKLAAALPLPKELAAATEFEGQDGVGKVQYGKMASIFLLAFGAGLVLNVMPCVLPVVGLKILSFVQQAGEQRGRIIMLNVWYSLGLMSVFMVLATLATTGRGWGAQFQSVGFAISLAAVVFVCALSFLGTWELPIPGFATTGTATKLSQKEGPSGAFAKGVLTTLLATPCAGPGLVPATAWAMVQPPAVIYATFAFLGLGMASPYLIIGAFPSLIRFLPKPGAWMDTFKQVMGFVLLGTVYFLFTFLEQDYVVPTFGLLIGLWFACWWIGRTPLTAELPQKLRAWCIGSASAAVVGLFAFGFFSSEVELPWQDFSRPRLAQLQQEGKTVLVDFTASWCLTCKTNEYRALNTHGTKAVVDELGIIPLIADKTHESPEIDQMLAELNNASGGIPYLAIFPANNPGKPILLDGLISESQLIEKLREAGPSLDKKPPVATAQHTEVALRD